MKTVEHSTQVCMGQGWNAVPTLLALGLYLFQQDRKKRENNEYIVVRIKIKKKHKSAPNNAK